MTRVVHGIDALLQDPPAWRQQRLALVTNHAATTGDFVPSRAALLQHNFNVVKLFSPEHGLDTTGADGHAMAGGIDVLTGLPVVSLYGDRLAPTAADLDDVDLVLFDIPDIGSRFYTYLWTMSHVLEACAATQTPLVILDRPNPLSGDLALAAGPMLDESRCASFIGRWSIPVRHSCTLGELVTYFNASRGLGCQLEVLRCSGWRRELFQPDWSASFVPLSPAIPTFESALLYAGLCLLEATNCSEGRGTATPFRVIGSPWLRADDTAQLFNRLATDMHLGAVARRLSFTPREGKYVGQVCNGIMLHVADPKCFRPLAAGMLAIRVARHLHPADFDWAPYPTHVNPSGNNHMNLLLGIPEAEALFNTPLAEFAERVDALTRLSGWQQQVQPFLLYA